MTPTEHGGTILSLDEIKIQGVLVVVGENVPAKVADHAKENLVKTTSESSICVDGGYQPEEALGELSRAGADLGVSLAIIALGLSPREAFEVVYDFRVENQQKYGWHSDTHVDPEDESEHHHAYAHHHSNTICGCGHCNAAYHHAAKYGVTGNSVKELLNHIRTQQKDNPQHMRFVNLDREHQEKGIFIVESAEVTILPWDVTTGKQFFVYDKVRDAALLDDIAKFARHQGHQVSEHSLKERVKAQTNATLGLLGSSQGKPVYSVQYHQGGVTIKHSGYAPEAS